MQATAMHVVASGAGLGRMPRASKGILVAKVVVANNVAELHGANGLTKQTALIK